MNKEKKIKLNEKKQLQELIDVIVEETVASIFFDPLTTAVKTAAFSIENAIATTKELIKGILVQIPTLIVPGLKFNYEQFMYDWDKKLQEVEKKYAGTLKEVFDALKNRDMWGIGFLLFPEVILGQKLLTAAPEMALRTLEILSGGDPRITSLRQKYSITPLPWPGGSGGSGGMGGGSSYAYSTSYGLDSSGGGSYSGDGGGGYGGFGESIKTNKDLVIEQPIAQQKTMQQLPQQGNGLQAEIQQLLKDPSFRQKIAQNPFFKDVKTIGIKMWQDKINEINAVSSLDDPKLTKMFGGQETVQKIKNEINSKIQEMKFPEKTSEEEKTKAKEAAIKQGHKEALDKIKEQYKNFYKQKLAEMAKQNPNIADEVALINQQQPSK